MVDNNQLQYLVNLIDDDTEEVRNQVIEELSNYGITLESDLQTYSNLLDSEKQNLLKPILQSNREKWLLNNWEKWYQLDYEEEQLEAAMGFICVFDYGFNYEHKLRSELDKIAKEFLNFYQFGNEHDLADFLFTQNGYRGETADFYNPLNSNLYYVIENKKGLPISLAIIFILVGWRLGMSIEGCNFPGHFLAKSYIEDDLVLFDCFNGGKSLYERELKFMAGDSFDSILKLVRDKTTSIMIVRRVLRNLINAYEKVNDEKTGQFFHKLLKLTPEY